MTGTSNGHGASLWGPGSKPVPPQYPTTGRAKLAFVGEAPSDDEVIHGVPLIGPSGKVYDQLLAVAGIERADVLTTNVFDFQLENNDVKTITVPGGQAKAEGWSSPWPPIGDRFLRPEFAGQLERLRLELAAVAPTVVVPLGGTALWAFTGHTRINQARGAVGLATGPVGWTGKIVPTYHPAHVLRVWDTFTTVVGDMMKAAREAERGPAVRLKAREIWLDPTLDDLALFTRRYIDRAPGPLSLDIETAWGQITHFGVGVDSTVAISVPFTDPRKATNSYWADADAELAAIEWVQAVCAAPQPKLMQNGPYDAYWLRTKWGVWVHNYVEDTRLMHHALYPEMPKSLSFMGATYADAPPWKLMRPARGEEKRDD